MRYARLALFLAQAFLAGSAIAQTNRYVVHFNSKAGTPYSIDAPEAFLSARALARRARQGISISESDLPVNPQYKSAIRSAGAKILYTSKWLNCALIEASGAQMTDITNLSFIISSELASPGAVPMEQPRIPVSSRTSGGLSDAILPQNVQLGIDQMQADGWDGNGILIAVMDSGFPWIQQAAGFEHIRTRIRDSFNFPWNKTDVYGYDDHGSEVLSIIAGKLPEGFVGSAPAADFLLYITEYVPTEYRIEEYNWLFAAERADSAGADVINTSLGYSTFDDPSMNYAYSDMDGKTTVISRAAKLAAERGMLLVSSAGNEGAGSWRYVTAPADVAEVLSVGAVNASGNVSSFSSRGPSADGRIKPDVGALGSSTVFLAQGIQTANGSGTSLAASLITGLAAGLMQSRPDLKAAEISSLIRSAGSRAAFPDNNIGYGVPDYNKIRLVVEIPQRDKSVIFFPNPVTDQEGVLQLQADDLVVREVELISSTGAFFRPAINQSSLLTRTTVDFSGTAPGLYLMRVRISHHAESLPDEFRVFRVIRR